MNRRSIDIVRDIDARFYDHAADSFSRTRKNAWPGWQRVLTQLGIAEDDTEAAEAFRLVDIAAGNLRFERFLIEQRPGRVFDSVAVDACAALLDEPHDDIANLRTVRADVLDLLDEDSGLARAVGCDRAPADAVCCFGFMHHVPTVALRERLLDAMSDCLRPGGVLAVGFWGFLSDAELRAKAEAATAAATAAFPELELEAGDRFLGWGDGDDLRYCHSFDDAEIDALAAHMNDRATTIDRFRSDGRGGALNAYLLLRRNA